MAVYSNIVIDQGADYTASIDVTDADGDAADTPAALPGTGGE